jgi:hypothetical protein
MLLCFASNDMDSDYGIEIWKIGSEAADKMWDTTFSTSAIPVAVKWANDSMIIGCSKSYEADLFWTFKLDLHEGAWKYTNTSQCNSINKDKNNKGARRH